MCTPAKKFTKRERSLADIDQLVPWHALIDLIELHYTKSSMQGCCPPYPLTVMLRIYQMQQ